MCKKFSKTQGGQGATQKASCFATLNLLGRVAAPNIVSASPMTKCERVRSEPETQTKIFISFSRSGWQLNDAVLSNRRGGRGPGVWSCFFSFQKLVLDALCLPLCNEDAAVRTELVTRLRCSAASFKAFRLSFFLFFRFFPLPPLIRYPLSQTLVSTMGMRSCCLLSLIIITFIIGGALLGLAAYNYRPARDFWDAGGQNPSTLDLWFYGTVVSLVAGCALVLAAILGFVVSSTLLFGVLPSSTLSETLANNLVSTIASKTT